MSFISVRDITDSNLDKLLIKPLHRQPHNIIIASRNILHPDKANPLLHPIGTGFIHRLELIYIIGYFFFAQLSKAYFRLSGKAALPFRCSYTNSGKHFVGATGPYPAACTKASSRSLGFPSTRPSSQTMVSAVIISSPGCNMFR